MVLRSKSVGEQDVADQQGVFFMPKDLTDVRSFLLLTFWLGYIDHVFYLFDNLFLLAF